MPQFMLLLHGGEFDGYSPDEMRAITARYIGWMTKATGRSRVVGGAPLKDGGKVLRGAGEKTRVTDGPFAETKEVVGGYYLIEAKDEAAAVGLVRDCPHLECAGVVELREVGDPSQM